VFICVNAALQCNITGHLSGVQQVSGFYASGPNVQQNLPQNLNPSSEWWDKDLKLKW